MRTLYLDCFSGISGDMTVGALIDLGVKPSTLEWELSKLDLGPFHLHFDRESRQHVDAVRFNVHDGSTHCDACDEEDETETQAHEHSHSHSHGCGCGHDPAEGDEHDHDHGDEVEDAAHHHHHHSHSPGGGGEDHDHGTEVHAHHPDHHHHDHAHGRNHQEIRALISESDLSAFVKKHALSMFHRIAEAEGRIHGVPSEQVQFHEVGALDSIVDIVSVCIGLEELGVEHVVASPLHEGRGWIDCAHGRFPIPSTATLEILKGIPISQIDEPFEFITPTGAAILAEFATGFVPMPCIKVEQIGYGAGSRKLKNRPNVLRAILGTLVTADSPHETDTIVQLQTNLDDLNPELIGAVMDKLFEAGALDVFLTPIQMKKNRPGTLLTVLAEPKKQSTLSSILFAETSTFGVRIAEVRREILVRRNEVVETEFGPVEVKLGFRGDAVIQASPEFESVKQLSNKSGQPLKRVYDAAVQAAQSKLE